MSVQRLPQYFTMHWKAIASYGGLCAVLAGALLWRLNNLVPGYSQSEVQTYQASLNLEGILDNPLNAPFLLLVKALTYIHPDSFLSVRVAAVACGLAVLVIFAVILGRWHDTRTALLGTLLFGLSAWFLHTARLGTPDILLFGIFVLMACGFWLKRTNNWLALLLCFLLTTALLYVPGMIWFITLGVIWQWKIIDHIFKKHLPVVTLAGFAMLGALAPLGWALYKNHALIKPWLGLPHNWPTPLEMIQNVLQMPFHFFVRNETNPVAWLGSAPILDVFCLTMFVLGGYLYLRHFRLARAPIFISVLVVALGLIMVGSSVTYSVIMPFVYLIIAAGVSHLLNLWFGVFPRNPIARGIGWGLAGALIAIVCAYHTIHYFVGWPQASATHEVFTLQKP
ncbi:MAG: hypothetical protein AAB834_03730 [Patescibacteria group bacterium]